VHERTTDTESAKTKRGTALCSLHHGSERMLGIPTFEDKVAQRAVTMMLEAVYEREFLLCSYGFRPGRSAHQARRTLQSALARGALERDS
jgi:retron-type reverse transcriptase